MSKVTLFEKPSKGQSLVVLVLSDIHSEYMDVEAFKIACRYFTQVPKKRRRIFLMGDVLDMEFLVSKLDSYKRAKKYSDFDGYFVPEVQKEYLWFEQFLEQLIELVESYSHITFFEGNHEERLRRPQFKSFMLHDYAHWFNLPLQLKFKERGINYIEYNDWLKIQTSCSGDLSLTHGIYCGANPIKKHFDSAHTSVMFGHTHERGSKSFKTIDGLAMGFNNPCMCGMRPRYMEGRPHNWSVGFSTIVVDHENFYVNQFTIKDGKMRDPQGRLV